MYSAPCCRLTGVDSAAVCQPDAPAPEVKVAVASSVPSALHRCPSRDIGVARVLARAPVF